MLYPMQYRTLFAPAYEVSIKCIFLKKASLDTTFQWYLSLPYTPEHFSGHFERLEVSLTPGALVRL